MQRHTAKGVLRGEAKALERRMRLGMKDRKLKRDGAGEVRVVLSMYSP